MQRFKDKRIEWAADKNQLLTKTRKVSFEMVAQHMEEGNIIDIIPHPNQKHYAHQEIAIMILDDYICAVPFVEDAEKVFLKTIYKSRKLKKHYEQK